MKAGWQIKKLGDVCQFINRLWTGEKPPFVNTGVFRNTNFTKDGTLDDSDVAYLDVESKKFESRRLVYGDLILEKSGGGPKQPVGRVALFDRKDGAFSFSNFTAAMRVNDPNALDFRFLHKFLFWMHLSGITETMQSHSTGIRNLDTKAYKNIDVPLPPVLEQQRIVRILDEAFEGIATAKANAEKNQQNARALFESELEAVFRERGEGWEEKTLGNLANFRNGINYTKDSKGEYVKIVGVRNFQKNFWVPLDNLDMVTIDGELNEFDSLKQGDILAVRSNGNIELIGRCLLAGEVSEKISHSGFTIRIRLSTGEALPQYFCHFMKSASTRKRLTDGGIGTNIKSLNQGMLSALVVPFPSVAAQKTIIEKLERISEETQRLEAIYQRKLAALEALKKSLLHQAFSGGL